MVGVEITKIFNNDSSETELKKFKNEKDLYNYVITDFIATTLESAREEMTQNEFTSLCLNICGFMSEYFT